MSILILGLIVFFGIHLLPSFASTKTSLVGRLGENAYKGIYSIISITGFVLIIYGKGQADFQPVWEPVLIGSKIPLVLMLISFVLLAAANMPSNIKRFTRHPMLWGITAWSSAHLLTNGDLASIFLFGGFGLFSLFDMVSSNLRGASKQEDTLPLMKDVLTISAGIGIYFLFLFLHPYLMGVSVI